jgi:hypothetical protein
VLRNFSSFYVTSLSNALIETKSFNINIPPNNKARPQSLHFLEHILPLYQFAYRHSHSQATCSHQSHPISSWFLWHLSLSYRIKEPSWCIVCKMPNPVSHPLKRDSPEPHPHLKLYRRFQPLKLRLLLTFPIPVFCIRLKAFRIRDHTVDLHVTSRYSPRCRFDLYPVMVCPNNRSIGIALEGRLGEKRKGKKNPQQQL